MWFVNFLNESVSLQREYKIFNYQHHEIKTPIL